MELAERIRRLIVASGLSVSELSRLTRAKYGCESNYFIADTFISTIRKGVSPHLCQVAALSEFTRHPFVNLMRHFGFDLQQLTWLQVKLHGDRTVLVTPHESFTWPSWDNTRYLYAKIGQQDGMAFPEIMPGSIVRIDTSQTSVVITSNNGGRRPLYVVDHLGGLSCCYVTALNDSEVVLTPRYLPYPCLQYRLGEQVRILGVVDAELRLLQGIQVPSPALSSNLQRRAPIPAVQGSQKISELLRNSRERAGLRFREARDLTARVAKQLRDDAYGIALGTLSDYEAVELVPRHISKIITLCAAYAIDFRRYLHAAEVNVARPPRVALSALEYEAGSSLFQPTNDRSNMPQPYFPQSLIDAQSELQQGKSSALETYSVWTGFHYGRVDMPPIKSFVVDRHSTGLDKNSWSASWQRPVYLVRRHDGKYIYGFCTVTDGILTVHDESTMNRVVERFHRGEANVVGQVVTMLRSVGGHDKRA